MKSLRNASSLILIAPNVLPKNGVKVLSLKRSTTTSHFPDAYVFPGGNSDAADHDAEWLSVLPSKTLNVPLNIIGSSSKPSASSATTNYRSAASLSEAVSLRITAIRETFEECGILLCKRMNDETSNFQVAHFELKDANLWREKVRKNAHEFVKLCRANECFPSISNLYFLSNWITPIHVPRRYTCKFFVALMDRQIEGEADGEETESAEWHSLNYLLENAYLPPPQIYELSMLNKFSSIDALCEVARSVNSSECEPYMPVGVNTEDGMVMLLPGDEKYDDVLDRSRSHIIFEANCTAEEYRSDVMHRVELVGGKGTLIIRNCTPRNHDFLRASTSQSKL